MHRALGRAKETELLLFETLPKVEVNHYSQLVTNS